MQFAALLTRSQRVSHENLRLRDRTWLEGMERWFAERASRRPCRSRCRRCSRRFACASWSWRTDRGVAHGHVFGRGRGRGRLPPRASRRARAGRGRPRVHRDDLRQPGGTDHARLRRHVQDEHVAAWTRIVDFVHRHTDAKICLQLGHSGPKGSTKLGWEGMDEPLDEGNWQGDRAVAGALVAGQSGAPADDARGHGRRARRVRARDRDGAGVRLRHGRAALRPRLSAVCVHHAAHEPAHRRIRRLLANRLRFPLEVFAAMRQCGPGTSRCRCASPRPTGSRAASPAMTRSRSPGRSRPGADVIDVFAGQTSTRRSPSTAACSRRRFPIVFATRRGSRPWRSATSSSPITSTASSPPDAPTSAAWRDHHLADPYWSLHAAAQLGYDQVAWPVQYLSGQEQYVRNLKRAADLAIAGMSPGAAGAGRTPW